MIIRPMISIITPVLDHPEFTVQYAHAVEAADEVLIVDTGSTPENRARWMEVGKVIDYPHRGHNYGHWCNAGYEQARGDVIIFLNNDVAATGDWLSEVRQVQDGAIYGPELQAQIVDGVTIPFLSGWCIAATRATWNRLKSAADSGPWDTVAYPAAGYWEDNDLCFRAMMEDIRLEHTRWPIVHLDGGNGTSRHKQEYYKDVARNRATFARRVREAMQIEQRRKVNDALPGLLDAWKDFAEGDHERTIA